MRHHTPDELLDVIEGARTADSLPHLATCPVCRAQVDALREVLTLTGEAPASDPSPLFWEHLSKRVAEAVEQEAHIGEARSLPLWARQRTGRLAWRTLTAVGQGSRMALVAAAGAVALVILFSTSESRRGPVGPKGAFAPRVDVTAGSADVVPDPTMAAAAPFEGSGHDAISEVVQDLAGNMDLRILLATPGLDGPESLSTDLVPKDGTADAALVDLAGDERTELRRLLREALDRSGA